MVGAEVDPYFWWEFIAFLGIALIAMLGFSAIMRKVFHVEKGKRFSYNHVNAKHKKVEWTIRITAVVLLTAGYVINGMRGFDEGFWFLKTWFILTLFIFSTQIARAVMEHKYAQNANAFKVTVSETVFILLLLVSIWTTDFWGLG